MDGTREFLSEVEAFLGRTGLAPSRFGQMAVNDRGFVASIRSGRRSPSLKTVTKVRDFMAAHGSKVSRPSSEFSKHGGA